MTTRGLLSAIATAFLLCPAAQGQTASARPSKSRPKRAAAAARTPLPATALRPGGAKILASEERRYVGEPISLDLKDADIRDVVLIFAELTRMNMVTDPEVKGAVTVRLESVPWDQALEVILKVNGLGYVLDGNVVRVAQPVKLQGTP